jgi:hypothetical protein
MEKKIAVSKYPEHTVIMILMSLSQSILSHVRGIADTVLINALAREGDDAGKPKGGPTEQRWGSENFTSKSMILRKGSSVWLSMNGKHVARPKKRLDVLRWKHETPKIVPDGQKTH